MKQDKQLKQRERQRQRHLRRQRERQLGIDGSGGGNDSGLIGGDDSKMEPIERLLKELQLRRGSP